MIPDELLAKMPIHDVRFLGGILLAIALSYLVLCFTIRKPVHIFGKEFVFPIPRIAVAQMVVAGVDLIAAAACMYVLLPDDLGIGFIDFLPSYLMAQVARGADPRAGGVGVFELVILHLTHTPREQAVFAAVLLFRLIYFILPLLAAAALLAVYEARQSRNTLREAGRWLSVLSHSIAAYTTFVGGCILLVSAMLPTLPAVVAQLDDFLPRTLLMGGHLVCALSGALLLFVAYGLERRQNRAFWMAVILLLLGIAGALLKGLSFLAAGAALVVLITVWAVPGAASTVLPSFGKKPSRHTGWSLPLRLWAWPWAWAGSSTIRHGTGPPCGALSSTSTLRACCWPMWASRSWSWYRGSSGSACGPAKRLQERNLQSGRVPRA